MALRGFCIWTLHKSFIEQSFSYCAHVNICKRLYNESVWHSIQCNVDLHKPLFRVNTVWYEEEQVQPETPVDIRDKFKYLSKVSGQIFLVAKNI